MRIKDKVAVITGAASGIGLAIATRFIAEGAKVVAADWHEDALAAAVRQIGGPIVGFTGNVAEEADCVAMIDRAVAAFGRIDILVNNAGVMDLFQSVADLDNATWRRCMAVNVDGPMFAMRRAVPLMLAQGGGSIINISSMNGLVAGAVGYTDTKFAVRGMTKAAAINLAPMGIRVNSVHPGVIATPMVVQEDTKAAVEAFSQHIPLKRVAQPEEVSNMVLFLASDEASYSTGSEFIIDGGLTAQ